MLPRAEDRASPELGAGDVERLSTSSPSPASPCPPSLPTPPPHPRGCTPPKPGLCELLWVWARQYWVGGLRQLLGTHAVGWAGGAPSSLNDELEGHTIFCKQRTSIRLQAYNSPDNPAFTRVPNKASGATPGRCCC